MTGTFFESCDPLSLAEAVRGFDDAAVDPAACTANARRFSVERFRRQMRTAVEQARGSEREPRAAVERARRAARRRPPARWRRSA